MVEVMSQVSNPRFSNSSSTGPSNPTGGNTGLALGLAIGAWIIPFIGFFMAIFAIILAKKSRKQNKDEGLALAALIIAWTNIVLGVVFVLLVVGLVGYQSWFSTYQSKQLAAVEMQTSSGGASINVERVQDGSVYLLNRGDDNILVEGLTISSSTGDYICTTSNSFEVTNGVQSYSCDSTGTYIAGEKVSVLIETSSGLVSSEQLAK